jgi:hypothetical protein
MRVVNESVKTTRAVPYIPRKSRAVRHTKLEDERKGSYQR